MISFLPRDVARPLRILCLGAHSDDIEIGCGGTVLQLLAANPDTSVHWAVFGADGKREDEARASAARFLDGTQQATVHIEPFPNSYYPDHWSDIKRVFENTLKPFEPDVIFTHYRDDRHQDHRVISDLAWNTFRNHMVLEYEIPKYDGDLGRPNLYIPLSRQTVDDKIKVLVEEFATQCSRHWFGEETFRGMMRLRGVEAATAYAEAFHARKICVDL